MGVRRYQVYLVFAILVGIVAGSYGHRLIDDNGEATGIIVTVFSILAGFLIAVMTLLGDQSILPGSWRIAEVQRNALRAKLVRQKWLFYLYLVTLLLIFISSLVRPLFPETTDWIERIYFGFASTAFLLSFCLPSMLMEVQMGRVEALIDARRNKASKLDKS